MHNLVYLADLCKEVDAEMERLPEDVTRLNPFAVDARYPASSEAPPPGVVAELVTIAEDVVRIVGDELGADP